MTKVLVTGGSGFIATHIIKGLLARQHTVFTTVRSEAKAALVRDLHDASPALRVLVALDMTLPNAFDGALAEIASESLQVVIHTAAPTGAGFTDPKSQLIDPSVNGTRGLLEAIVQHAPTVRRVVVTSSMASLVDPFRLSDPSYVISEETWNPVEGDILSSPMLSYLAAKTLSERAAWDFVEEEKPAFDVSTICPPFVYGLRPRLIASLDDIKGNTTWAASLLRGKWKTEIPATSPFYLFVDVEDVAKAHILAMDLPRAPAGRRLRLLPTSGPMCNRDLARIVRDNFPEFADRLPGPEVKGGEPLAESQMFKYNNDETVRLLGMPWTSLENCVVGIINTVKKYA